MKKIKLAKTTLAFLEGTSDFVLNKYIIPDFILYKSDDGTYYLLDENDNQEDLNEYLDGRLHSLLSENGVFMIPNGTDSQNYGVNTDLIGEA